MKRNVWIFLLIVIVGLVKWYFGSYGPSVKFKDDCNVYYKDGVTEAQAKAVGDYLVNIGFFTSSADVQLRKDGGKIQVRFVVKKEKRNDAEVEGSLNLITARLQALALGNEPTECVIADDRLDAVKTLPSLDLGKAITCGAKSVVFYTDAAGEASARKVADWMLKAKPDLEVDMRLDKKGNTFVFSLVVDEGAVSKPGIDEVFRNLGTGLSEVLGAPVETVMASSTFKALKTIPPASQASVPSGSAAKTTEQPADDASPAPSAEETP